MQPNRGNDTAAIRNMCRGFDLVGTHFTGAVPSTNNPAIRGRRLSTRSMTSRLRRVDVQSTPADSKEGRPGHALALHVGPLGADHARIVEPLLLAREGRREGRPPVVPRVDGPARGPRAGLAMGLAPCDLEASYARTGRHADRMDCPLEVYAAVASLGCEASSRVRQWGQV